MTASFETLRFELAGGVATITLSRPERLNAFTRRMHEELREALAEVRSGRAEGRIRALLLTGAGRAFCAGQDLDERRPNPDGSPPDLGASIEHNYKPLVLALRALEMPVIAAVNGVAAGAGASLALACDLVVAARSASFIQAFSKLGLVPDTGGSWILPRLLGPARAMGLALLGERLSAEQAAEWGLIWQCVDDDALLPSATALAARLAAGPTLGYARTKQCIWASSGNDFETQLDLERDLMRELGRSDDYREGVAAFKEKRAARFTGH